MKKEGIPYCPLEDFQVRENRVFVEDLLKKQIHWAQKTDEFLHKNNCEFKKYPFFPARYYLYYLKNSWDTFIHRWGLLNKLHETYQFDVITHFGNSGARFNNGTLTINGSSLSESIFEWTEQNGIKTNAISPIESDDFWTYREPGRLNFKKLLCNVPFIYSTGKKGKNLVKRVNQILRSPFIEESQEKIILKQHYDINDDVCNELKKENVQLLSFEDVTDNLPDYSLKENRNLSEYQKLWDTIRDQDWFWDIGEFRNGMPIKTLENLHKKFWFQILPELWFYYQEALVTLNTVHPNAILVGNIFGTKDTSILMAARSQKIPVIFYMHGANMGDVENTVWDVTDRYYCDYLLVYGNGEEQYIKSRPIYGDISVTPIPVGSARLDAMRNQSHKDRAEKLKRKLFKDASKPICLYVPGVIRTNFFRYQYHDFFSIRVFDIRKKIAELFHNHPEIQFVYKSFLISEGEDPTDDMLADFCPTCKIIKDVPLPVLLWMADVSLQEVPSTGMHEALLTDKQTFVLVDRDVWNMPESVKTMLRQRVRLAEDGDQFINHIEQLLMSGNFFPERVLNDDFLKMYFTYQNDGKSAQRAGDAIKKIIHG